MSNIEQNLKSAAISVSDLETAFELALRELEKNTGFLVKGVEEKRNFNSLTFEVENIQKVKIILGT